MKALPEPSLSVNLSCHVIVNHMPRRKEYGGIKTDQLKRLKEQEKKNERLRCAASNLTLDKLILKVPYK